MRFVAAAEAAAGPAPTPTPLGAALPPQKSPPSVGAGGVPWARMGVEGLRLCAGARTGIIRIDKQVN